MKRIPTAIAILLITISSFAQKTTKVKLDYIYYATASESLARAQEAALEAAKIDAIAQEFGTIVSSVSTSSSFYHQRDNGSTISSDDFYELGSADVRGEWIETTKKPTFDIKQIERGLSIHVLGEGIIREVVMAPINFKALVLRNGTDDKFQSDVFHTGDDMFVSFTSPIDGYLSIYLIDNNHDAFCLLPYQEETDGAYQIAANKRYVLFSRKDERNDEIKPIVDEMSIIADFDIEYNQIYVIFSPNRYTKASDVQARPLNDGELQLPRQLSFNDFQKWLEKGKKHDTQMCVQKSFIKIIRNK